MKDWDGNSMQHFNPYPSKLSAGVNVFSQDWNPYVFPPFSLIFPLLKFLKESKVEGVTIIIPDILPKPVWWPLYFSHVKRSEVLSIQGEVNALYFPGKKGCAVNRVGLRWSLIVVCLCFNS